MSTLIIYFNAQGNLRYDLALSIIVEEIDSMSQVAIENYYFQIE